MYHYFGCGSYLGSLGHTGYRNVITICCIAQGYSTSDAIICVVVVILAPWATQHTGLLLLFVALPKDIRQVFQLLLLLQLPRFLGNTTIIIIVFNVLPTETKQEANIAVVCVFNDDILQV